MFLYDTLVYLVHQYYYLQLEFLKKNAKFWATRPLTQNMIDYASNDVSSLLIDVYVHQKRY
jgi:ribonuclease D